MTRESDAADDDGSDAASEPAGASWLTGQDWSPEEEEEIAQLIEAEAGITDPYGPPPPYEGQPDGGEHDDDDD